MSNLGSAQSNGCQCPLGVPWWHGPVTRCPLTPPPPSLLFTGSLVGRCTAMVWTPRKQWNVAPAKSLATAAAHLLRSDPPPWPEQPLSTHAAPPPQQYLAILTSRHSDPLALNFGHMRCWCQDANCCINFGHFKLKVVILMCLEVAQSKVVISKTNHFIHWTRQPPISSPRSLLAQSNSGSADKWCPVQTKPSQVKLTRKHGEYLARARARIVPCLQFYSSLQEVGFIFSPQNYLQHLGFRSQSTERIRHRERGSQQRKLPEHQWNSKLKLFSSNERLLALL